MVEQRQSLRSRVFFGGVVPFNEQRSTIDCIVRNFSDGGAKIELENPFLLPEEIDLVIERKNRAFRAKMVWRQANYAGFSFRPVAPNELVSLDLARRLRRCEAERRVLQSRIAQLTSER